jgi:hypothetical protein
MQTISITHEKDSTYRVIVDEDGSSSTHVVAVWPSDVARYAPGFTPEELLEASFEFLLEHEPKESILPRFELPLIERYFPAYAGDIRARLSRQPK